MNVRRKNIILKMLEKNGSVTLEELLNELNVSEATIRRDLNSLEEVGKIIRIHGGAVLPSSKEDDIRIKKNLHIKIKEKIAKKAIKYVKDGDIIYLDAGTTTGCLIKLLGKKSNIIVITNGISHLEELNYQGIETHLLGGEIKFNTGATVGISAVQSLRNYNIDIAFLGANSITANGYSTPDTKEAIIKSEVAHRAKQVFFLCDSSKFNKKAFINFAFLEMGTLITDGDVPKEIKDILSEKNLLINN